MWLVIGLFHDAVSTAEIMYSQTAHCRLIMSNVGERSSGLFKVKTGNISEGNKT
jgi:hypothetical protein